MSTSLGPFDMTPIIERVRAQVPALELVGGAAERAAAVEGAIALPAAFIVLAGEDIRSEPITGSLRTETTARIHVITGVRHYQGGQRGQAHADVANRIVAAVRTALHGWTPAGPTGTRVESIRCNGRAELLKLAQAEWWWLDPFTCTYRGRT